MIILEKEGVGTDHKMLGLGKKAEDEMEKPSGLVELGGFIVEVLEYLLGRQILIAARLSIWGYRPTNE